MPVQAFAIHDLTVRLRSLGEGDLAQALLRSLLSVNTFLLLYFA